MFKRNKLKKQKCSICDNLIDVGGDNAIVVLTDNVRIEICDECEKLMEVISTKYNELLEEKLSISLRKESDDG